MRALLGGGRYPARNVEQNLADLRAQVAACAKGAEELAKMVAHFGAAGRARLHEHVQDNAEESVRRVLDALTDGSFAYEMDDGARDRGRDPRRSRAARGDDRLHRHRAAAADQLQRAVGGVQGRGALRVPHAGRRRDPDERRVPEAADASSSPRARCSSPRYPAAVVAGNVETSQAITDALYGALGVLAASQGTMNNFTFGNDTLPVLRDDLRRLGRGAGLRRHERRADAHDQLAADRSRGARVALPGAARVVSRSAAAAAATGRHAAATAASAACASSSR